MRAAVRPDGTAHTTSLCNLQRGEDMVVFQSGTILLEAVFRNVQDLKSQSMTARACDRYVGSKTRLLSTLRESKAGDIEQEACLVVVHWHSSSHGRVLLP